MSIKTFARIALGGLLLAETQAALTRLDERARLFLQAAERARTLGRPLIVVGNPDGGMATRFIRTYGCGDMCVDLKGCPLCPVTRVADITQGPLEGVGDDSAVVYVSCVLEYVGDLQAALMELARIAGSPRNLYIATVQPWTLTSVLYPGARWTGIASGHAVVMEPVSGARKGIVGSVLVGLAALAIISSEERS